MPGISCFLRQRKEGREGHSSPIFQLFSCRPAYATFRFHLFTSHHLVALLGLLRCVFLSILLLPLADLAFVCLGAIQIREDNVEDVRVPLNGVTLNALLDSLQHTLVGECSVVGREYRIYTPEAALASRTCYPWGK